MRKCERKIFFIPNLKDPRNFIKDRNMTCISMYNMDNIGFVPFNPFSLTI